MTARAREQRVCTAIRRTGTRQSGILAAAGLLSFAANAQAPGDFVVSKDGRSIAQHECRSESLPDAPRGGPVPFPLTPDWSNTLRLPVSSIAPGDLNGDQKIDVVIGCYNSVSQPPFTDFRNRIYYNTGSSLETDPSWVSGDQVSTSDVRIADFNLDTFPDVFAANGYLPLDPCVIYFGSASGPNTSPGWFSAVPNGIWSLSAIAFDIDHDQDVDILLTGQGGSANDAPRPVYIFRNQAGALETTPGWQTENTGVSNYLALGDYDHDGWEDVAVSRWINYQTAVFRNVNGTFTAQPVWTVGNTDPERGVAWGDVDADGFPELAVGHNPTRVYDNQGGTLLSDWTSTAVQFDQNELTFHDVDRDDDIDLIEVNFSTRTTRIYLNQSGVLDTLPSWSYLAPNPASALAFADINGDGRDDLLLGFAGNPSLSVFLARPLPCAGDIDNDGDIDIQDLALMLAAFGASGAGLPADLDADNDVDLQDLATLLGRFGRIC